MDRSEIKDMIEKSLQAGTVPPGLNSVDDLKEAVSIAGEETDKAYGSGNSDMGDAWAKMVMMLKIHSINHLEQADKFNFIADIMGR